jgi:tetratricopeptide repeat protein
VMAGSLADRGRLRDAVAMLERRGGNVQRPAEHHLRVWYALADLCERTGDLPRARELFDRVRRQDPAFADVAERRSAGPGGRWSPSRPLGVTVAPFRYGHINSALRVEVGSVR